MDRIKLVLIFFFIVMLLGVALKTILPTTDSYLIVMIGVCGHVLTGSVYFIYALKEKQKRIEAGMVLLSFPMAIGIMFSSLHWPAGDVQIIIISPILVLSGIALLIYSLVKEREIGLAVLYLATCFGSLFFTFRYLFWPGGGILFFPFALALIVSLIVLVVTKQKLTSSVSILLLLNLLLVLIYFTNTSTLYRFKHLDMANPESNFADNYHRYAFYLYREGNESEAKTNLEYALYLSKQYPMEFPQETSTEATARYERALLSLNSHSWKKAERPSSME